jgi:protein pelota
MIIEKKDLRNEIIKLRPQNQDDLWLLSQILDVGSFATAKTTRKIKISETKVEKKTYILKISISSVKYENEILRILGKVVSEVEDIPKGSSQSISIEINDLLTIEQKWLNYQIDKLEESTKEKVKILLVIIDREEAYFAKMTSSGYEILSNFKGEVFRKSEDGLVGGGNFYQEVGTQIEEYVERLKVDKIVVASPAFFKEDFLKQFKNDEVKKKIFLATVSSVSSNAFVELLKRDEVKSVFAQERFEKELFFVDKFFENLGKNSRCSYGFKDVEEKSEQGAVEILLLTTKTIAEYREKEDFKTLEDLMKLVEQINGKVLIIDSSNDAGKRLDGIMGIGAVLRY